MTLRYMVSFIHIAYQGLGVVRAYLGVRRPTGSRRVEQCTRHNYTCITSKQNSSPPNGVYAWSAAGGSEYIAPRCSVELARAYKGVVTLELSMDGAGYSGVDNNVFIAGSSDERIQASPGDDYRIQAYGSPPPRAQRCRPRSVPANDDKLMI